jgi:predicted nuclease of predicted toxin-antitoxin system
MTRRKRSDAPRRLRFIVDHCVPAAVARRLRAVGHDAWTAYDAHLEDASDESLIIYAQDRDAILVTTNRDCARLAQRMGAAQVIWLQVLEVDSEASIVRAVEWLQANHLPIGRVLRVPKQAELSMLAPAPH